MMYWMLARVDTIHKLDSNIMKQPVLVLMEMDRELGTIQCFIL